MVHQPTPLAHAISGSLGSALSLLLFYPLERVRTELQASASSNERFQLHPTKQQSAGDDPEEAQQQRSDSSPNSSASNESWVTCSSMDKNDKDTNNESPPTEPSVLPELTETTTTTTRKAVPSREEATALMDCFMDLHNRNELYQGVMPVVTSMGITNFIFFFAHQAFKGILLKGSQKNSAARALVASTLAGIVNVFLTNPLWVANLRIIKGSEEDHQQSLWRELRLIVKKDGFPYLWNGTLTSLLLVSNPVIQFFCYEQLKQLLIVRHHQAHGLSAVQAFVLGALAKAIATVATYPLQLAQVLLRLDKNEYKGTMDCLVKLVGKKGAPALFRGMKAKLLQTTLTAAFTFLSYEQILNVVQATIFAPASSSSSRKRIQV